MRLIDADAITKWLDKHYDDEQITVGFFDGLIKRSPTVDAVPVKYGKWIETKEFHGYDDGFPRRAYACSECHVAFPTEDYVVEDFRYCPNCGARMRDE